MIKWLTLLIAVVFVFAANPGEQAQWEASVLQQRQEKDQEFKTSPTSPMAAVKRLTIDAGAETFILETNRAINLSPQESTGTLFSLSHSTGQWHWHKHAPAITCTIGDKPAAPGAILNQRTVFNGGQCVLVAYPSTDRLVILAFDPLRPQMKHFSHLVYFPPNPKFALPATLRKCPTISNITMLTSRNQKKTFHRYATIHFEIEGKAFQLTAFKFTLQGEGSDILFIPFSDQTNDKETYGSGRFLEVHEPKENQFTLDFNLCYNPLCNYSHEVYNCPLPPMENALDIPIKAGEKTYPH